MTAPAITPATGVPSKSVDLIPPIGTRGLPMSWTFHDWRGDAKPSGVGVPNFKVDRMALFDENIWATKKLLPTGASGTQIQPEPITPSAQIGDFTQTANPAESINQKVRGLSINQSPPCLLHGRGSLVFSQTGLDISRSFHDVSKVKGSAQFQTLTFSNCGRFVDHPEENYASARPANHSWQKFVEGFQPNESNNAFVPQAPFGNNKETDHAIGTYGDGQQTCTDSQYLGGEHITSTVFKSISAIPSNGLGIIYGDSHNSIHYTNLVCSTIGQSINDVNGGVFTENAGVSTDMNHWCINLGTHQPALASGTEVSKPDGLIPALTGGGWSPLMAGTYDTNSASNRISSSQGHANLSQPQSRTQTIQQIFVKDFFSDGTAESMPLERTTLGRPQAGNSVVHDTVGLIGFEGTITATAFYQVSKDTDTGQTQGAINIPAVDSLGYAGLNIQVHSGFGMRRNATAEISSAYRYGSDGTPVRVMSDAMRTASMRISPHGDDSDANQTWFRTGTPTPSNNTIAADDPAGIPAAGVPNIHQNQSGVEMMGSNLTAKIIGVNMPNSLRTDELHNSYSTGQWIANGVPTKVQIIPVITGYEDVQVSAGASKVAAGHSDTDIKFRKPLVDYHVLVSITEPRGQRANTDPSNPIYGNPTQRNIPDPTYLSSDGDYSKQGCFIYHGIFRINPSRLEQIFIDTTVPEATTFNMASEANCPRSVIPRHDYGGLAEIGMQQGWGLHQATPMRPLALNDKYGKVPRLCGAIEGGGFYQRGGISHLWDGCEYNGEIFVGADCIKPHELQTEDANGTNEHGQNTFGIFGNGQIWADGSGEPKKPTGMELFIWRYSTKDDPIYPPHGTQIPMNKMFGDSAKYGIYESGRDDDIQPNTVSWEKPRSGLKAATWEIHDWVMPQVELMRYLGREEKQQAEHFEVSGTNTYHPSLHCSSLRIMDDGRFLMAAVHVDYIKTEADYPTNEIRYPLNPDLDVATCPAGYYYSGGQCIPLVGSGDVPQGFVQDPQSGDVRPSEGHPAPVNGTGSSTPNKQDNFSLHPTWSKLKANTQARSLIMMFSDVKADDTTGLAKRGKALFDIEWNKFPVGDGQTQLLATQVWNYSDTWWSGSRIAYWYQESGQRAIPITYGSYPDCRMSYANLPRSLPFLINEHDGANVNSLSARIQSGFPTIQPATVATTLSQTHPNIFDNLNIGSDSQRTWTKLREKHLKLTRFVPTTIGFADFGAGANPYQEWGWSGWSFPRGLYDPMGYGDNSVFFSDAPEAEDAQMGAAITPTEQAIFKGMGQAQIDDDLPAYSNPLSPNFGYTLDLSSVVFPVVLESAFIYKLGTGEEKIIAPATCGSVPEVVAELLNAATSTYGAIDSIYTATGQPALAVDGSISTQINRPYDPNNPPTVEQLNLMVFDFIQLSGVKYYFNTYKQQGARVLRGALGGFSHHGALHYGMSTKLHPYRVDRVMKQVHGGVGYDLPLHLLKPPKVHARARAGATNSIELEMETPFHRTDNIHLLGATEFNTGFDLGGQSPPNQPRPVLGQYYLRTNLWDRPLHGSAGVSGSLVEPLDELSARVHGPIISGSQALEAFWSDHPTDHFHASAMPILPNTDYDLAMIETENYSPMMLARANEIHDLDVLALGEQLQSSVDVHVSKSAKPYWDSGAIVSAQGEGYRGGKGQHMIQTSAQMNGLDVMNGGSVPSQYAAGTQEMSMGMGQRSLRTPDGTLHQFHLRRSAQAGSENLPQWTHYKKPLYGDVFWNSKAMKSNQDQAVHNGLDECGVLLNSIGANIGGTSDTIGRVMGAAFCSDSNGTIHAVIEYHANPSGGAHMAHRLYYHKAERKLVNYNPEPVYDWDWSVNLPVLIQNAQISNELGGSAYDLRQPSIVCDAQDRIHLVCTQIFNDNPQTPCQRILYTVKLASEDSFPTFTPDNSGIYGMPNGDRRWQLVHNIITDAGQTTFNDEAATAGQHLITFAQEPKVVLRGDNVPVVFYRGKPIAGFTANRMYDAIYCNIGKAPSSTNDPSGTFIFEPNKPIHVVGLRPDSKNTIEDFEVQYYDAIVDEKDIAYVVSTKDDYNFTNAYAPRQTLLTYFDTNKPLLDQYNSTDGLGTHLTIWEGREYTQAGDPKVDNNYRDLTLTTNGKGELHLIMTFCMLGDNPARFGETFRDAATPKVRQSAIAPLQWVATPSGDLTGASETPYIGGFIKPAISPNWTGQVVPPMPPYKATNPSRREHNHIMHIWIPSIEYDSQSEQPNVLRSMNIRWLSVPSVRWDSTVQSWIPVGSAQTMAGEEDFPHHSPQLRYQRFWGFDASELDLRWHTNELSWYRANTDGSSVYYPSAGGVQMQIGSGEESGQGIAGFPNGV